MSDDYYTYTPIQHDGAPDDGSREDGGIRYIEDGDGRKLYAKIVNFWEENGTWIREKAQAFARVMLCGREAKAEGHWGAGPLHVRNILTVNAAQGYFHRKNAPSQKGRVFFMMDASGSMSGGHFSHGTCIAAAFNELAHRGIIDFDFVLSGGVSCTGSEENSWYNDGRPIPRGLFQFMKSDCGCEAIAENFKRYETQWSKADRIFVYTDGAITDGDVDPHIWRKHDKVVLGCYVGNAHQRSKMMRWFDHCLSSETREILSTQMINYLRRAQSS